MASLYADENFPLGTVEALRRLGHDVLTALESDRANRGIPDEAVLAFAASLGRAVLTLNRWEFIGLHARTPDHAGIVVCTQDPDVERLAAAVNAAVKRSARLKGVLLRINLPS